ncbi:MAG: isoleucine--tRNA ligase [Phycisphaeraceae bacterium]|nr:MAG: isoleucine--tRNA ligase [Phycisphaeraceae bacterium]
MSSQTPSGSSTPPKTEAERPNYRKTLNLPKTAFPMKASLVQNEPASMKRWKSIDVYRKLRERGGPMGVFNFHDGPPYANGDIHLGHLLNKCLKDLVVRTRSMAGADCPFVPGWDCHGLPIEHKVMTELVQSGKFEKLRGLDEDTRRMAVRKACRADAEKFMKVQAEQMQRLLTLADYDNPYFTMDPGYEGAALEVFADLVEQGLVHRALKPVHWSIANETALAEAELEYEEREDPSIYVEFEALDRAAVERAFGLEADALDRTPTFMIWTTTPWTLPANLVIAVHERVEYALVEVDGSVTVLAKELIESVTKKAKAESVRTIATTPGAALLGLRYRHPLLDAAALAASQGAAPETLHRIVGAEYVTIEDGTGLVHTAPGHGADDHRTGLKEGLPVYCPVGPDGRYDTTAPEWLRGKLIWDANPEIIEHLRTSGHMFFDHMFMHSYPHDWRGKSPVIFRATEQWFILVDKPYRVPHEESGLAMSILDRSLTTVGFDWLNPVTDLQRQRVEDCKAHQQEAWEDGMKRESAGLPIQSASSEEIAELDKRLNVFSTTLEKVNFIPEWGRNRMRGMLETRPDWCISRQRAWGLPIPAFTTPEGATLLTPKSARAVAAVIAEKGSDAWFTDSPAELLRGYDPAQDADAPKGIDIGSLSKSRDIFDVWFESGCSWAAVLQRGGAEVPCDLYLEGSDQHRGWFQVSLLTALGATGSPPYRTLLTHGFIVDKHGRKMSKSLGNTINVLELLKQYGADVCRWWVASLSYENDIKADIDFFETAGESYRKVRNTLRFMLSNLSDFEPSLHGSAGMCVDLKSLPATGIDAWALAEFNRLSKDVRAAYDRYDFRAATSRLYNFCNDTLSAVYLAAVKDRLYCDRPDSARRRRTQTALWELTDGLARLLAPVLPHTADEAWRTLLGESGETETVHTRAFIESFDVSADASWVTALEARDAALAELERVRAGGGVENPLDAAVTLPDPEGALAKFDPVDLADLLGVSRVQLDAKAASPKVLDLRMEPRCERSWKRDGTVKPRSDGGVLSDRDAEAIGVS